MDKRKGKKSKEMIRIKLLSQKFIKRKNIIILLKIYACAIRWSLLQKNCVEMQGTRLAEVNACPYRVTDFVSTSLETFRRTANIRSKRRLPLTATPNNAPCYVSGQREALQRYITTWTGRGMDRREIWLSFDILELVLLCRTHISYSPHTNE
jgi:hypothetical protein